MLLASDLHSNSLVLPVLAQYSEGRPVFFVGDFAELGTRLEGGVVPEVAALGAPVVAVSGNHDTQALMDALAEEGVLVLSRESGGASRSLGSRWRASTIPSSTTAGRRVTS